MALVLVATAQAGEPLTPEALRYPEARLLKDERVYGRQLEIHWSCWASRDAVEAVAARYETDRRLEPGGWRKDAGEWGFQAKADHDLHVAVFPAVDLPRHTPCRAKLEPGERTVVQISLALPRGPSAP